MFRFLKITCFLKKKQCLSLQAICTVLSNRNSLRDDSKPSPLRSPQGRKSPFWITPQERQPFPHPIPENLKSEKFPFPRFTIFNSPFHSAVSPFPAQPLHPCQHSVGLTRRFTSGLGPTFRRWSTTKQGLDSLQSSTKLSICVVYLIIKSIGAKQ